MRFLVGIAIVVSIVSLAVFIGLFGLAVYAVAVPSDPSLAGFPSFPI